MCACFELSLAHWEDQNAFSGPDQLGTFYLEEVSLCVSFTSITEQSATCPVT